MNLIDVDGIISVMKQQAGCATCDNYNGIRCRACQWDDAITSVYDYADYHTVDAIPVKHVEKMIESVKSLPNVDYFFKYFAVNVMDALILGWREEQEKQNESTV